MNNLPIAIILGAQKCGTSTLYNSLINHTAIGKTADPVTGTPIKEVDFFCVEEKWSMGVDWYTSHFGGSESSFIDCSPNYLSRPISYARIYQTMPDIKLIICIRNPIFRAYSQYNHYRQALPQSLNWDWNPAKDFLTNIRMELIQYPDCETSFNGLLAKGVYVNQIKQLLKYFKREQIYISILEKWENGYRKELATIQNFLNLPVEMLDETIHHRREYTMGHMDPEAFDLLRYYYELYDDELFELMGHEISEWTVGKNQARIAT